MVNDRESASYLGARVATLLEWEWECERQGCGMQGNYCKDAEGAQGREVRRPLEPVCTV